MKTIKKYICNCNQKIKNNYWKLIILMIEFIKIEQTYKIRIQLKPILRMENKSKKNKIFHLRIINMIKI